MTEPTSRILAGLEGVLLCLPLTGLFLYGGLPSVLYFLNNSQVVVAILDALICIVISVALICGWRLLLSFIFGGHLKLQAVSTKWWAVPYATAGLSLFSLLFLLVADTPSEFAMFGWGLPLILPLAHLHFERKALRVK
jgi:hypothetical protein